MGAHFRGVVGLGAFLIIGGVAACGGDGGGGTDGAAAAKGGSAGAMSATGGSSGAGGKTSTGGAGGSVGTGGAASGGKGGGPGGGGAGTSGGPGAGGTASAGAGPAGSGGSGTAGSGFAAPHVPPPPMVNQGGPVVKTPHLVTVSFKGYGNEADLTSYGDWIVQSNWLDVVGKDYGIGKGTHTHVALAQTAPAQITDAQIGTLVSGAVTSGALPAPGSKTAPDTIYLVVFPEGTSLSGFAPCSATNTYAGAFHGSSTDGLVYGVVGQCPGTGFNPVGFAHEFIEAATDPFYGKPAWVFPQQYEGEIADFCGSVVFDGHQACRVWSNTAAAAGIDPCVPGITEPYFSVSFDQPGTFTVPAGTSLDVALTGWSTGPVADWDMITDVSQFSGAGPAKVPPTATVAPNKLNNGKTATLTLSAPANADKGIYYDVGLYMGYLPPGKPSQQSPSRHLFVLVK